MCVVVPTVATLALSAASSAIGYIGQQQQAAQQQAYNNALYEQQAAQAVAEANYQNRQVERNNQFMRENAANAEAAAAADRAALVSQERQQSIATAIDIQNQRVEKLRAQGAIRASERAGLSLDSLLLDFDRQFSQNQFLAQQNLAFASGQRVREQETINANLRSRINQARPYEAAPFREPAPVQQVQGPSLLGTVIGFGSQAASTLNSRSVYDNTSGRYRIDRIGRLPTTAPTYNPGRAWVNDVRGRFNNGNSGLN